MMAPCAQVDYAEAQTEETTMAGKTDRCPDCFGTGVEGGIKQTKQERKCPTCKGKGTVKK